MNTATRPGSAVRTGFAARPGVTTPDWSVVTSAIVAEALEDMFATCHWDRRWAGFGADLDRTRRAILETWADKARAPSRDEVALVTGFASDQVAELFQKLAVRDMVVLDQDKLAIVGAYPFVDRDSEHRVEMNGRVLNAMCAIDALGSGAMLASDSVIKSACRRCACEIEVRTSGQGTVLDHFCPDEAVVWTGIQYGDNCSANSLCTTMAFFCCDDHLSDWRADHQSEPHGYRLSMAEGFEMGKAIFVPLLAASSQK